MTKDTYHGNAVVLLTSRIIYDKILVNLLRVPLRSVM